MAYKPKYFTMKEMTRSSKADELKIKNTPNEEQKNNILALIKNVLDPAREKWGAPICVSSGFRTVEVNRAVGGAVKSEHLTGCAADLKTVGDNNGKNLLLYKFIKESNLPFHKLIWETSQRNTTWVHVSFDQNAEIPVRQCLIATQKNGKWTYKEDKK